jgi:hypothetical protein
MSILILDLDNCISDDEWRREFIDWSQTDTTLRYASYHDRCGQDQVGNRMLFDNNPHDIVVFTSRPERVRRITEEWLVKHIVPAQELFMRPDGDRRTSLLIKHDFLYQLLSLHGLAFHDIGCAYDDHPEIVVMYRALGVAAECRAINGIYRGPW